jgi:glucose uptake protein GlcU
MRFEKTKMNTTFATIGFVGGMFYAMKQNKDFKGVALYGIIFGFIGVLASNQISKFQD